MWDAQFREFSPRYRVVRYDHRGFGKSKAPQAAYSPTGDLLKLLDHLSINKAHLIGNSMGGTLALDFALKHPDRVSSLVVVASGARGYPHYPQEDIDRVVAVFRAAQEKGVKAAAGLWLAHPMVAVSSKKPGVRELLEKMVNENSGVFLMDHWPNEDMKPAAFERLGEIKSRVLIIVGDRDTHAMQAAARATAKGIPGAEIVVMTGADHLPQMTHSSGFNRIVAEFLSRKG
jgi:pimeloyl-ACP methyl ester carboxylesterase